VLEYVHGRDHVSLSCKDSLHRLAEGRRGQLHLAELVDHDECSGQAAQGRDRKPVQGIEVDAVLAYAGRTRQIDVRERRLLTGDGLDGEPDAPAALADLLGGEARDRNVALAQSGDDPSSESRLPGALTTLEQDAGRLRDALVSSSCPCRRGSAPST
jgi:hypothetical protein